MKKKLFIFGFVLLFFVVSVFGNTKYSYDDKPILGKPDFYTHEIQRNLSFSVLFSRFPYAILSTQQGVVFNGAEYFCFENTMTKIINKEFIKSFEGVSAISEKNCLSNLK
jgi:hypothetical protein